MFSRTSTCVSIQLSLNKLYNFSFNYSLLLVLNDFSAASCWKMFNAGGKVSAYKYHFSSIHSFFFCHVLIIALILFKHFCERKCRLRVMLVGIWGALFYYDSNLLIDIFQTLLSQSYNLSSADESQGAPPECEDYLRVANTLKLHTETFNVRAMGRSVFFIWENLTPTSHKIYYV